MKSLVLAIVLISAAAMATPSATYNCTFPMADQSGLIKALNVDFTVQRDGTYAGEMYPLCPQCTYVGKSPINFTIDEKGFVQKFAGSGLTISINMESFAPTTTHPSELQLMGSPNAMKGQCTTK